MRFLAGNRHEADPSKPPHETGPASGPREAGHATLGEGHCLPSSTTPSPSLAIAPVAAVGASADTPISHGPELLTFIGVVGVEVVAHAVPATLR